MKVEKTAYLGIRFDCLYSIYVVFAVAAIVRYVWLVWRSLQGRDAGHRWSIPTHELRQPLLAVAVGDHRACRSSACRSAIR